jgi:hypothetical protein
MRHRLFLFALLFAAACMSSSPVDRVQAYRAAVARGADVSRFLAPDARLWYDKKEGAGEPLRKGAGSYAHWDHYFGSKSTLTDWQLNGRAVSAVVHETNGFYRLLDWEPDPYRMTWWLDDEGRIGEALLTSIPGGGSKGRLAEFRAWARDHHSAELDYLMPNGHIDPKADRAERFAALLREWRSATGLPPVVFTPAL